MATDLQGGAREFRDLAVNLIAIGETGLRDELYRAVDDAAGAITGQIGSTGNLRDHMPDPYADVLAKDLKMTVSKRATGVTILARAPTTGRGGRKIRQREAGIITHPLFGDKERWFTQTKGMREGFFTTPAERAAPSVREKILQAVRRVQDKALGRG